MGRTKLDNRIRTLVENGVATGHRSMFAVVGNKAKDQVVILHHILSKASVTARPSVLWCYKKDLGFSSNRQKRAREIKAKQAAGNTAIRDDDPFEVFVSSTQIRYCYYSETHKILGNTFGMLVLQDFEALTPNLLARTIETIEGGGLVVLLMQSVNSLRQLFTLTMDVHNRYRTEAHTEIVARFNERFILSLASCQSCCVVDDQLNILPISSHINKIEALPPSARKEVTASDEELSQLKESMKDTKPIGDLLVRTRTACQAKCVLRLLDVITEKQLNATCSITAARGRGKSAALGLSLAGAIAFGYTNIFVTSPSPENLKTLFQFVVKGFDAIDYQEHTDYELVQSTNPEFNKALVRINVFREHRQTIQYIHPSDAVKLGQAELVVIDEAAAIPLPLVKDLISGSYLVFLASTVNGYEGTGRSLSLKLLQQLRQQAAGCAKGEKQVTSKGRVLHEMVLEESIRYKPGDKVENWLNRVLCLDAAGAGGRLGCGTPPPRDCQLYYVNRDTLFSFHKASESFLHQLMSIYVSAHYKNTPNDLQMLSDAPAHHLFVLMAPVDEQQSQLPDVLAVVQVCLEGSLSKERVEGSLQQGKRAAGDLLPWTISQQFMDSEFPTLCGARIVRLAVHPDYQSMGYGGRAMELLQEYYMGRVPCLDEKKAKSKDAAKTVKDAHTLVLLEEQVAPRVDLPPLLRRLDERKAERLDYIGVSYGLTLGLLKFWKKAGFVPVYVRQNANDLTGEYTCIMLRKFEEEEDDDASAPPSWLSVYWGEFRRRIVALLGFEFRKFPAQLALSILQLRNKDVEKASSNKVLSRSELGLMLSNTDLRRLSQFAKNMADHTLVTDMLPTLGRLYFNQHLGEGVKLSAVQAAILLAIGLQHKSVDDLVAELDMPANQILALYVKTMRRLSEHLDGVCADAVRAEMEKPKEGMEGAADATKHMNPLAQSLEDEMNEAEAEIKARQARDKKNMLNELSTELQQYAIKADDEAWKAALQGDNAAVKKLTGLISVKSKRKLKEMAVPEEKDKHAGKKKKRTTHMDKGIQK